MSNSKDGARNNKLLATFLKERGLKTVFRRFKSLRGRKRTAIKIVVGGETRPSLAFKTKNRIIFRDPQSLAPIHSTTKYKTLSNIPKFFKVEETQKSTFLGIKLIKEGKFVPQFRRTDVKREIFKHTVHIETQIPLKKKVGKIFLKVKFTKKLHRAVIVEGGSRKLRLLNDKGERQIAFDEAFKGAMSQINFSYDNFLIINIRFAYKVDKEDQKLVFI